MSLRFGWSKKDASSQTEKSKWDHAFLNYLGQKGFPIFFLILDHPVKYFSIFGSFFEKQKQIWFFSISEEKPKFGFFLSFNFFFFFLTTTWNKNMKTFGQTTLTTSFPGSQNAHYAGTSCILFYTLRDLKNETLHIFIIVWFIQLLAKRDIR